MTPTRPKPSASPKGGGGGRPPNSPVAVVDVGPSAMAAAESAAEELQVPGHDSAFGSGTRSIWLGQGLTDKLQLKKSDDFVYNPKVWGLDCVVKLIRVNAYSGGKRRA